MNSTARNRVGFTIVELLIVVVVIAILAAIVIVAYNGIQNNARRSAAQSSLRSIETKLKTYAIEHEGSMPAALSELGFNNDGSLTYQYTRNESTEPKTFCVTVTSGNYSYHVASNGQPTEGACAGHTGGSAPIALNCPAGFVTVPGNSLFGTSAFCVMKYEAKDAGGNIATSTASGLPWVSMTQIQARNYAATACTGCHLLTANEWLTIAHNVMSVPSNWRGGVVGVARDSGGAMFNGHNDNTPGSRLEASANDTDGYFGTGNSSSSVPVHEIMQRRTLTLTNGAVIWDFSGNVWEWIDQVTSGVGSQPGLASDTSEVYKDWTAPGITKGNFPQFFPGYGTAGAATWGSQQGLGQLITNANYAGERGFIMGGAYTTGYVNTGAFTLRLNYTPSQASSTTGFRAAVTPQ